MKHLALLTCILFFQSMIFCDPADLDTSFSSNGYFYGEQQTAFAAAIQPDNKIVAVGQNGNKVLATRYLTNGLQDSIANGGLGFGTDGQGYMETIVSGTSDNQARNIALQSDGKIVSVGTLVNNTGSVPQILLNRYLNNGLFDTVANGGSGFGTGRQGFYTAPISDFTIDSITGLAIQSDGSIIIGGYGTSSGINNLFIIGFTSDGVIDTSFGTSGITTISIGTDIIGGRIALQDDKILITGATIISSEYNLVVARFNSNGSLDTTFGSDSLGYITTLTGSSLGASSNYIITQTDDTILIGGSITTSTSVNSTILARYTSNGSLDTTFGSGVGYVTTSIPEFPLNAKIRGLTTEPSGKIIAFGDGSNNSYYSFIVIRYNTDGSLDTDLNALGYITPYFGAGNENGYAVPIQDDGKLILVGQANNSLFMARYLGGTTPQEVIAPISSYGFNPNFVPQSLYSTFYATTITDPTAQAATIAAIDSILSTYSSDYTNQPNFNYINYLYLLENELAAAHITLNAAHPDSSEEIDLFFSYINDRILTLITPV